MKKIKERLLVDAAPPIVFHRELGLIFGIEGALFVQQLYYWSDKGTREDGYIYKSKAELEEETLISRYKQDKIVKELKKLGVLLTKVLKVDGAPTLHYKLEIGKVSNLLLEKRETYFWKSEKLTYEGIETETTTETTTDMDTIQQKAKMATKRQPSGNQIAPVPTAASPTESAEHVEIVNVIELFSKLNPSVYRLYGNKTQRGAAKNLLKHQGLEKVTNAVHFLEAVASEQYAPVITTPLQLESKWGVLQAYYIKKQGQTNQPKGKNYD